MDDYLTKGDKVTATWIDTEPKALSTEVAASNVVYEVNYKKAIVL